MAGSSVIRQSKTILARSCEAAKVVDVWDAKQREFHRVKYWEIIADNLSKAGFSWGCVSAVDSRGRTIWVADAHCVGKRFVVQADELLTAFIELILQKINNLAAALLVGFLPSESLRRAPLARRETFPRWVLRLLGTQQPQKLT